ncbi:MAG: hypothetical protein IT424_16125 [Pirellulales bacterium]|nr:hypothetical protein [Pirellulales bacterium]
MTLFRSCCVLTLLFGVYPPLKAAVIQRDWKTPGDGLLTYDDVNQREWLDLSQTVLSSQFPGDDREAKYQFVLEQTSPSGAFAGFTTANAADVLALARSAGIDTSTLDYDINTLATRALCELVATTAKFPAGLQASGLLNEVNQSLTRRRADFGVNSGSQAGLSISLEVDRLGTPPPGVFLFRNIAEPTAFLQAMGAAILIHLWRRNRHDSASTA